MTAVFRPNDGGKRAADQRRDALVVGAAGSALLFEKLPRLVPVYRWSCWDWRRAAH